MRSSYATVKRFADAVLAGLFLVLAAPLIGLLCVLVLATIGRPVFFHQQRAGLNGKPFTIIKLRTMADGERTDAFGRFLRASGLDELPQLWNVLIGDMSLVGPRPLLVSYLDRYSREQRRRLDVRPGITGWAQVNGRNKLDWSDYFEKDVWYVDNMSPLLDARIVSRSLLIVISAPFVSDGMILRDEFMGSPEPRQAGIAEQEAGAAPVADVEHRGLH